MSDKVHRYILAYDVEADARRNRVAKTLESFGDRLQYSVFIIDAKPAKMIRLKSTVAEILNLLTDSLLICDLGPLAGEGSKRIDFVGAQRGFTGHGPLIM